MATTIASALGTKTQTKTPTRRTTRSNFLSDLIAGLSFARGYRAREREAARLMRLSDDELAKMGLTRDEITACVWADRF